MATLQVKNFIAKILKFKMAAIFEETKFFLKIGMATLQRYPVGEKFPQNCSIANGFQDISIFVFCTFCEKFENSKWPPFLTRKIFLENWDGYYAELPCGSNISSKSLYLAWFSRYKHFCVFTRPHEGVGLVSSEEVGATLNYFIWSLP